MNRQAQSVIMLLLGGAVLKISLGDLYLRYVKEGLRPFLILSGVLLVAAAVMTLWHEYRSAEVGEDESENHDRGHAHAHGGPLVGWLIIAPVLGLLLVAPPAMGAYAAGQSGTALSTAAESDYPPLPPGDVVPITVLDYASRAVFDKGVSLGDRKVKLVGFLVTSTDGQQVLGRMILSCCAADARPIKVAFAGQGPTGMADDAWVEIVGTYTDRTMRDAVNDEIIPFIVVTSWRPVDPPKQQYE
ncbi:putative repeat protein (TIGR03943 family) [Hamadaea flava]|uniref:TIGR03943 family putative permease subunit n=1 Tax=Hamadaea flava TaxID=1742688 RepID=A0ABV8LWK1_9ACTN|nr:TIGR03943 family protein [Hamadaea flava]MCP2327460.1 putative repeat protein (TIGR03943 family) [Hamadaea flava]